MFFDVVCHKEIFDTLSVFAKNTFASKFALILNAIILSYKVTTSTIKTTGAFNARICLAAYSDSNKIATKFKATRFGQIFTTTLKETATTHATSILAQIYTAK